MPPSMLYVIVIFFFSKKAKNIDKKIEAKNIQQYPTGCMKNLTRGKTKTLKENIIMLKYTNK